VPVAPARRVGAAGKTASGVSGDQGHGLTAGCQSLGSAEGEGDAVGVDDGGPDFGPISDPQELISTELAAVTGFGEPGFGEQIIDTDGDDDRCRYPTNRRLIGTFQHLAAHLIECVMHALPVGSLVGNLLRHPVDVEFGSPRLGQGIQDGIQLCADGSAEFALQLPHAVAALLQLQMPTVLLQLIIDGFRPSGSAASTTRNANRFRSVGPSAGA